ncbi:hypothetical protein [Asticcacaulis sp. W401b]|uniref:hypothetical protein n=1 Tax=Asticcacaulis sp. W401b TaxID=3388666 RepID=UPI003970E842
MDAKSKHALYSTLRENIIEHIFAGELLKLLWQRGIVDAEILKSEFDAGGYDLVLSCRDVTRHIQLKIAREGGSRSDVSVNLNLAKKPSGCVVWIVVNDDLDFKNFLWFGSEEPHNPLPPIDHMKVAKHAKGTAEGIKNERPNHRLVKRSNFTSVATLEGVLFKLLGRDLMASVTPRVYVSSAHSADFLYDEQGLPL